MSEATLTLRELFEVDTKDLSARVEPGLDVYQAVQNARQEIAKESRAIRWPWVRKAVAEESQDLLNLKRFGCPGRRLEEVPANRTICRRRKIRSRGKDSCPVGRAHRKIATSSLP